MNIKTKTIKECKICKKEMFLCPSRVKKTMVCSRECNIIDIKSRKNMLGKHHTKEAKQKISEKQLGKLAWNKGLLGYRAGKGTRANIMPKGTEHWSYKKDRTQLKGHNSEERRSSAYVIWRSEVWKRDNWKCKINNKDCRGKIEAHHILSFTTYPELRHDINNGITLCHFHHPRKRVEEVNLSPYFKNLVENIK